MARKSSELRPVMVRLPETLRRRVERDAERNGRSMNTEIIHRIEQSFALDDDLRDKVESLRSQQDEAQRLIAQTRRDFHEDLAKAQSEVLELREKINTFGRMFDRLEQGGITEPEAIREVREIGPGTR